MSEQKQMSAPWGYHDLGSVNGFAELRVIWNAIWDQVASAKLPNGDKIYTRQFKGGTLWAVDYKNLRYMQQNPNTRSAYADRAKDGAKIVWVIRRNSGGNEDTYLGYIEEGIVYLK